ncbi:MAG: diguanylate cyclase [Rhodocyclaceae bacterium]|nr:diguanylate cyclase [Rhodocyclaceae bacterium]
MTHPTDPPANAVRQNRHRLAVVWLSSTLALSFLAAYWWSLAVNHKSMREDTVRQAEIRAAQSADAMAQQIAMLVRGIDYVLQTLSKEYLLQHRSGFDRLARGVVKDYPAGAIVQISVVDAQGMLRYTSLDGAGERTISIADREHFQDHLARPAPHLYIGKPIQGRLSGRWSIQFSRPLWRDERFMGVIVLSLSPGYLASLLGQLAGDPLDTVYLVHDDGSYLARSSDLDEVLGTALPPDRPFLAADAPLRGNYSLSAKVDGIHRFYGWRKLPDLGLNLGVGLASSPVLAPVEQTIRLSRIRSAVGTGLVLLACAWIVLLFWRIEKQKRTLRTIFEVLPVGVLIVDRQGEVSNCNAMAASLVSSDGTCSGRLDSERLAARLIGEDGMPLPPGSALGQRAWAGQERISGEVVGLLASDGEPRWLSVCAAPLSEERHSGAVVVLTDIGHSKRTEIDLAEKEARLRLVLEAARYGIWDWNIDTGEIHWDARCAEMLGHAPGRFSPRYAEWIAMLHEADKEKFVSRLQRCMQSSEPFDQDFRARDAQGDWQWLETRGKVVEWDHGRPVRMIGIHTDIGRRVAAGQLRRALLDNGAAAIFIANPERRIEYANLQVTALLGYAADDLLDQSFRILHLDEAHYRDFGPNYDRLQEEGQIEVEFPFRHRDGSVRWCSIHGTHLNPFDDSKKIVWTLFDNTARHFAQEALRAAGQRLETIVDRFPAGVLVVDTEDRITHSNRTFASLFGPEFVPERLLGMRRQDEIARLAPLFEQPPEAGPAGEELRMRDGRILTREEIPIAGKTAVAGRLLIYRDITEYKQREEMLEHLATTDALTELANRRSFVQRCEMELGRLRRHGGEGCALVMFDLDHFKRVNDTRGHAVGDQVLVHVASIVRQLLRTTDAAGRIGGEEFMVLLPATNLAGARRFAERLRRTMEDSPITGAGETFSISTSLGITTFPRSEDDDLARAMIRADQALYAAKARGRNRVEEA